MAVHESKAAKENLGDRESEENAERLLMPWFW